MCDYVATSTDADNGVTYTRCSEPATWNVADAKGAFVGCSKVCLAHAQEIVASQKFGILWPRTAYVSPFGPEVFAVAS